MRRRPPLPQSLAPAFTPADAGNLGLTSDQLRRPDVSRPFRGVRTRPLLVVADEHPADTWRRAVLQRASALKLVMPPGYFFSHTTAALIWGLPIPVQATREGLPDLTVDVCVFHPRRTPRIDGARGHQVRPELGHATRHAGFAVPTPATTWAMLGTRLELRDLVATGDAIVHIPRMPGTDRPLGTPLGTIEQLRAAMMAGRRIGIRNLREALPLVRTGSASRPETIARLELTAGGVPEPALDVDVYDGRGILLGCSELAYPQFRIAVEYEGDHHRVRRRQWNRDIDKYQSYAENGWTVVRVTSEMLFGRPEEAVRRVRSALLRAGWVPET
jgi:hypothetical protein